MMNDDVTLRISLFGRTRLCAGARPLRVPLPKVLSLLAYLVLHHGTSVERRAVAAALWPDEKAQDARANLRRHLHELHRMLPPARDGRPWIVAGHTMLAWNDAAPADIDVVAFERSIADPDNRAKGAALYEGELLPDVDEPWLWRHRERFAALAATLFRDLIAERRARRDFHGAITYARAALRNDPLDEEMAQLLMTVLHESGNRAGALHVYDQFATRLRDELEAEPMAELRGVMQRIRTDASPAQC